MIWLGIISYYSLQTNVTNLQFIVANIIACQWTWSWASSILFPFL